MKTITDILTADVRKIVICGHVNPDGDCVGSCMALFLYLRKNYPEKQVMVYLEEPRQELRFLTKQYEGSAVRTALADGEETPDLFVLLDAGTLSRVGVASSLLEKSHHSVCIDHHLANDGIADVNHVEPDIGSCAEVLYGLLDPEKIDLPCAEALYTGMVHDTGAFQYSNTRPETLRIAADLLEKGVDGSRIIYDSFNARTYVQTKILGYCLSKSILSEDGKVLYSQISLEEMKQFNASKSDVGEVVSQLKLTGGIYAAVFAYEMHEGTYKLSFRSTEELDVNNVANALGGGGHARAAGAAVSMPAEEVYGRVMEEIYKEMSRS